MIENYSNESVRSVLVGCGKVGHTHAQALKKLPGSNFLAVCDTSLERAEAFATTYGVQAYSNLEAMLAETQAQMLCVCTPHPAHASQIAIAGRNRVHVLRKW